MPITEFLNEKLLAVNIDFGDKKKLEFDFDEIFKRSEFLRLLKENTTKKEEEKGQ
jgi:hypothetical protein